LQGSSTQHALMTSGPRCCCRCCAGLPLLH
jgi:hypothetical protein